LAKVAVPPELIKRIKALALSDSRAGFLWHYHLLALESLPEHTIEWVHEYYNARACGEDLAVEAFRGSLKTTIVSTYLTSYGIANHPELETSVVQANDIVANENTSFLARLISDNPGWKFLYRHIAPDEKRWGAKGYDVKRNDMTYGEWGQLRSKAPTVMGGGYKSALIVGKHPRLHFIRDDVNGLRNTRSIREMNAVNDAVFTEQKPAADRAKMEIDIFTPWAEGDVGDLRKKTPRVRVVRTPVTKNGEVDGEPTWPFGDFKDIKALSESMPWSMFALSYLLRRDAMQGTVLRTGWLHDFEAKEINPDWPTYLGIDYASVARVQEKQGRDFFSLSVFSLHPQNFLVLIDGYRAQVSRAEAEDIAIDWGNKYNQNGQLRVMSIENLGKGEEYANWMLSNAPFHVKPQGVKNKSKGERFEIEMAPLFRSGQVRISNTDLKPAVDFIEVFRHEWASWNGSETNSHTDTLDSSYHGILGARFRVKPGKEAQPSGREKKAPVNAYQLFVME
jgi:hypothetical protein